MTTIVIGRDPKTSKLKVSVGTKYKLYGQEGSVPLSVSREHCSIEYEQEDGTMTINNLKTGKNTTSVNGLNIQKKEIKLSDIIMLGSDRYVLDLKSIMADMPQPIITVRINHLKAVWETYHDSTMGMKKQQGRQNAFRAGTGVLSMHAVVLSFIDGMESMRPILYIIAFPLMIYFAVSMFRQADNNPERLEQIQDKFRDNYICPHCNKFLGTTAYKYILKEGKCPRCGCIFKG